VNDFNRSLTGKEIAGSVGVRSALREEPHVVLWVREQAA
jgi:hypothetical protein